jgi:hypothetical protein
LPDSIQVMTSAIAAPAAGALVGAELVFVLVAGGVEWLVDGVVTAG